jgi:hypothetical protein
MISYNAIHRGVQPRPPVDLHVCIGIRDITGASRQLREVSSAASEMLLTRASFWYFAARTWQGLRGLQTATSREF